MKIPVSLANKLLQLLNGEQLPASLLKNDIIAKMIEDGVVQKLQGGKSRAVLFINNTEAFTSYLLNHFSISNLQAYVDRYHDETLSRNEAIALSGDSKLKAIRTFTGFPMNLYNEMEAQVNGKPVVLKPLAGMFHFVHDYEHFCPDKSVTIVGIENPENFRAIEKQQYLFADIQPLFVSRYPQSNDLIKWLKSIPNPYLHFGDLDFEGIRIYLHEYKKHLDNRATFFIPGNSNDLLSRFGNRGLYSSQLPRSSQLKSINEQPIVDLIASFHQYKKVLEQEIFIKQV